MDRCNAARCPSALPLGVLLALTARDTAPLSSPPPGPLRGADRERAAHGGRTGRSGGCPVKTVPDARVPAHGQQRENRSVVTTVARTWAACPERGSHVPPHSAEDTVVRERVPAVAGNEPQAHPRGTGSGQWAVRSDRHCSAAEEAARPELHGDESPQVPSAGHRTREDGRDGPTRGEGRVAGTCCLTGRWLRRWTHLSEFTACTLCSADRVTCKLNLPQELIYRKTAGFGPRLPVGYAEFSSPTWRWEVTGDVAAGPSSSPRPAPHLPAPGLR